MNCRLVTRATRLGGPGDRIQQSCAGPGRRAVDPRGRALWLDPRHGQRQFVKALRDTGRRGLASVWVTTSLKVLSTKLRTPHQGSIAGPAGPAGASVTGDGQSRATVSRRVGQAIARVLAHGRKVRAPAGRVPGNAWEARAYGKCHRK